MKILVLDNYDSFVYNLVHIIRELGYGKEMDVIRNDKITLEEVDKYDKILLSPGPGIPSEAGIMMELIKRYAPTKSIFGVCLGHQAIGETFGATLSNMDVVLHGFGMTTTPTIKDRLFDHLPNEITTARYHSWVVDKESISKDLPIEITAMSEDDCVMAIRHKEYNVRGVQFHPESVLTQVDEKMIGKTMLKNWLEA
jgi:anthranilate synthase component 2